MNIALRTWRLCPEKVAISAPVDMSHSFTVLCCRVTNIVPSGENARLFFRVPSRVALGVPVASSQSLISPLKDPEASAVPSCTKAIEITGEEWSLKSRITAPVATSHTLISPLRNPDAKVDPSGEKTSIVTQSCTPENFLIISSFLTLHKLTVLVSSEEASRVPSGEKETAPT